MAKDTVLAIVQQILSDGDGDIVNGIADTVESQQVADLLKDVFDQIVEQYDMRLHNTLQQLTATSSSTPTIMERPEGFHDIQWVKYDKKLAVADDQSYQTFGFQAAKDLGESLRLEAGTEYSLYKFNELLLDEDEDVRVWFVRARYDWKRYGRLNVGFSYQRDDRDTYRVLDMKYTWRF